MIRINLMNIVFVALIMPSYTKRMSRIIDAINLSRTDQRSSNHGLGHLSVIILEIKSLVLHGDALPHPLEPAPKIMYTSTFGISSHSVPG